MFRSPSHLDVRLEDGGYVTWELGCTIRIDGMDYTLCELFVDHSDEPFGTFCRGSSYSELSTRIDRQLRSLGKPPPLTTTPVYEVSPIALLLSFFFPTPLHPFPSYRPIEYPGLRGYWSR